VQLRWNGSNAPYDASAATGINGDPIDFSAPERGAVWLYCHRGCVTMFITGSDFLMDGGVTASYWYGELAAI
jgi:hypothetical protein